MSHPLKHESVKHEPPEHEPLEHEDFLQQAPPQDELLDYIQTRTSL